MARAGISGQLRLDAAEWKRSLQQADKDAAFFQNRLNQRVSGGGGGGRGGRGSDTGGKVAQSVLQAGYAVDDLQYGMRGIVNNIAPMLSGFGPWGALLAGIGTVGAVAFMKLKDAMGSSEETQKRLIDGNKSYQEMLKGRDAWLQKVEAAAKKYVEVEKENIATNERFVQIAEKRFAQEQRTADLRRQLQAEQIKSLPEAEQPAAEANLQKAAIDERLKAEQEFLRVRMVNEQSHMNAALKNINDLKQKQYEYANMPGKRLEDMQAEAELPGKMEAAELRRDDSQKKIEELQAQMRELARSKEEDVPIQKALADEVQKRQEQRQKDKAAEDEKKRAIEEWTRHELRVETEIQEMRARGLNDAADQKEMELKLEQDIQDLKAKGFADAEAASLAQRKMAVQVTMEEKARKDKERGMVETLGQMRVNELRATGKNDAADDLEKRMRQASRRRELEQQGFTPRQAGALAQREEAVRERMEDNERLNTRRADGRKKIIGAGHRSRRGSGGDDDFGLDWVRGGMGMPERGPQAQRRTPEARREHEERARKAGERGGEKAPPPAKADPAVINQIEKAVNTLNELLNVTKTQSVNRSN